MGKSFWCHSGFRSLLLLLGILLGLGVLAYVLVQIESPVPVLSTTNAPTTTATTRTTSVTWTSALTTTTQPEPRSSTGMITDLSPGWQNITSSINKLSQSKKIFLILKTFEVLKSLIDYKRSYFADPTPWNVPHVPSICLYAMATTSSLLVVYLAVLYAMRMDFRARLARLCGGWERMPQNETLLLHTLPYYLAITRSSCEVTSTHFSLHSWEGLEEKKMTTFQKNVKG